MVIISWLRTSYLLLSLPEGTLQYNCTHIHRRMNNMPREGGGGNGKEERKGDFANNNNKGEERRKIERGA